MGRRWYVAKSLSPKLDKFVLAFRGDKPPKSIPIMNREVQVKVVKDLTNQAGEPLWGLFSIDENLIRLEENCHDWREILLHESIHGFLELSTANHTLTEDQEEVIVKMVQYHIYPLLKPFLTP